MSTANSITIARIQNAGYMGIMIAGDVTRQIPRGKSADVNLPLAAGAKLTLVVRAMPDGNNLQTIFLWYELADGMNQFYYDVQSESKGKKAVLNPTSPDSDVQLDLGYSGDGVVIVGTGDM